MSWSVLDILNAIFMPLLAAPLLVWLMYIPDEPENHKVCKLIVKYVIPAVVALWVLEIITFVIQH